MRLPSNYTDLSLIAEGGMGAVFRAKDTNFNRMVAIKVLRYATIDARELKRFHAEAKALSKLNHPNIISVLSFGQTDEAQPYMVLEYFDGESLDKRLKQGARLNVLDAAEMLKQICSGLGHAHANGIVHRDIKPGNVLISKAADHVQYRILDFGIAQFVKSATQNLTQSGSLIGTPAYASPEQCIGGNIDGRSDIYSLGCLMYQALTGHTPFTSDSVLDLLRKQCDEDAPAMQEACPEAMVPTGFERIVQRCMMKSPADRFQNTDELLEAICKGDTELPEATTIQKKTKRSAPLVVAAALGVSLPIFAAIALLHKTEHASPPPIQAARSNVVSIDRLQKMAEDGIDTGKLAYATECLKQELEALNAAGAMPEKDQKYVRCLYALGCSLHGQQDDEQALEYLEQAYKIDSQDESVIFNLGLVNLGLKNYDQANRQFTHCMKRMQRRKETMTNEYANLMCSMAQVNQGLNRFSKAREFLKCSLAIDKELNNEQATRMAEAHLKALNEAEAEFKQKNNISN